MGKNYYIVRAVHNTEPGLYITCTTSFVLTIPSNYELSSFWFTSDFQTSGNPRTADSADEGEIRLCPHEDLALPLHKAGRRY